MRGGDTCDSVLLTVHSTARATAHVQADVVSAVRKATLWDIFKRCDTQFVMVGQGKQNRKRIQAQTSIQPLRDRHGNEDETGASKARSRVNGCVAARAKCCVSLDPSVLAGAEGDAEGYAFLASIVQHKFLQPTIARVCVPVTVDQSEARALKQYWQLCAMQVLVWEGAELYSDCVVLTYDHHLVTCDPLHCYTSCRRDGAVSTSIASQRHCCMGFAVLASSGGVQLADCEPGRVH